MPNRGFSLFVVLVSALILGATAQSVRKVIVVHRHGARTPFVTVNKANLCLPHGMCGMLNDQGKDMLTQLGLYLRRNYNSTLQPYGWYDPNVIWSRSTDVPRTLQSAEAMVRGLYSHLGQANVYPVINTLPRSNDPYLAVYNGLPSMVLMESAWSTGFNAAMENQTLQIFTRQLLTQMGNEVGLGLVCSGATFSPFQCAFELQDFWNSNFAEGNAAKFPLLHSNSQKLTAILEVLNSWSLYKYDEVANGGKMRKNIGSLGYTFVNQILADAQSTTDGRRLHHYSGHDTTMFPLWQALGNVSITDPGFAIATIFEVTTDNRISAKVGQPTQTPGTHQYTFETFKLTCIDSVGREYVAGQAGCPIADLQRYVTQRQAPASPLGNCYANEWMLKQTNCLPNSTSAPTGVCKYFRQQCPLTSCTSGFYTEGGYTCAPLVPVPSAAPAPNCSQWTRTSTIMLLLALGAVVAIVVLVLTRARANKSSMQSNEDGLMDYKNLGDA